MKDVLITFDQFLSKKNLTFEATIIGGAALIVMGVIDRATKDVDCLDPHIPPDIKKASIEFAKANPHFKLIEHWLNNGPDSLKRDLGEGWRAGVEPIFEGKAMKLYTLGRLDLLKSKLFACCDRDLDFNDCLALNPTSSELDECIEWVIERDGSPLWPKRVDAVFKEIKKAMKK